MLNKYIRLTIIVLIKFILPAVLLLLLVPQLLQFGNELNQIHRLLQAHQIEFLIAHNSFYLLLFWFWPRVINSIVNRNDFEISPAQIKSALRSRWYLLAAMVFFEVLVWWG